MKLRVVQKVPHRGRRPDPGATNRRGVGDAGQDLHRLEPTRRAGPPVRGGDHRARGVVGVRRGVDVVVRYPTGGPFASCVAASRVVAARLAFRSVPRHGFERAQMFRGEAEPTADLTARQHPAALQPQHAVPLRHVRHRRLHQVHLRRFDEGDYPRGRPLGTPKVQAAPLVPAREQLQGREPGDAV